MAETYRLFIAVKIPATEPLREVIGQLGRMGRAVKPVLADNLHVTLKFLGDTDSELVPLVEEVLQKSVQGVAGFEARLVGLGAFPHARRPSVIWAGMENGEGLAQIAERLERDLKELGFAPEKRCFHPHLTLARVRSKPPGELFQLLQTGQATCFGTAAVESVELYRSELHPDGARYWVLASAGLDE